MILKYKNYESRPRRELSTLLNYKLRENVSSQRTGILLWERRVEFRNSEGRVARVRILLQFLISMKLRGGIPIDNSSVSYSYFGGKELVEPVEKETFSLLLLACREFSPLLSSVL